MAKIRVEQIKDLMLTPAPAGNENVERSIQIGANSIIPLTGVSFADGSAESGYISAAERKGNVIELTRTALPVIEISGDTTGTFVLGAEVDTTNKHKIDLTKGTFDVATTEGAQTGSLLFGDDKKLKVNAAWVNSVVGDGKLKVKFGTADATDLFTANAATEATLTLAKVASTGKAEDVNVAAKVNEDGVTVVPAGTVQGTLESIAAEIDAMDLTATDVVALNTGKTALQAGKISESDGKVSVATAETLVEFNQALTNGNKVATMADVTAAAEVDGEDAIVVTPKTDAQGNEIPGNIVSLKIAETDNVLTQGANGLLANIELKYDSDNKKIKLFGKEGNTAAIASLGEIDATDFIKDGMLADATIITATNEAGLTPGKRYIKFTFKTYQNGVEGEEVLKVEYLDVESLIDSYTSGNEWIVINQDTNTISHETQSAFTPVTVEGQQSTPQTAFGGDFIEGSAANDYTADATLKTAGTSIVFNVPSFTVDAAGHIKKADDKTVKVALPAAQTITGETAIADDANSAFISTAVTATKGETDDNYTLSSTSTVKTQAVATAAAANGETPAVDGLATALDVKEYVDSKVAGATEEDTQTLEFSKVVKGTRTGAGEVTLTPGDDYKIEAASVCVYINGQLIPNTGYTIPADSNTVTIHANQYGEAGSDFVLESTDRIDVVAHATKTVTLTYLKLQTTQNA